MGFALIWFKSWFGGLLKMMVGELDGNCWFKSGYRCGYGIVATMVGGEVSGEGNVGEGYSKVAVMVRECSIESGSRIVVR
ncbi:hypothetical protein V6N13_051006 [Hibiscus sabdariffa]